MEGGWVGAVCGRGAADDWRCSSSAIRSWSDFCGRRGSGCGVGGGRGASIGAGRAGGVGITGGNGSITGCCGGSCGAGVGATSSTICGRELENRLPMGAPISVVRGMMVGKTNAGRADAGSGSVGRGGRSGA
ncbi:MAG TPA: hypothetical protein DFI00_00725 [Rhodospirillaceae bacterium]|nr:hypothetical protein [Rhodospirillaceae bacterium]